MASGTYYSSALGTKSIQNTDVFNNTNQVVIGGANPTFSGVTTSHRFSTDGNSGASIDGPVGQYTPADGQFTTIEASGNFTGGGDIISTGGNINAYLGQLTGQNVITTSGTITTLNSTTANLTTVNTTTANLTTANVTTFNVSGFSKWRNIVVNTADTVIITTANAVFNGNDLRGAFLGVTNISPNSTNPALQITTGAGGTLNSASLVYFGGAYVSATSSTPITRMANVYIAPPCIASTNVSISNNYSLYVDGPTWINNPTTIQSTLGVASDIYCAAGIAAVTSIHSLGTLQSDAGATVDTLTPGNAGDTASGNYAPNLSLITCVPTVRCIRMRYQMATSATSNTVRITLPSCVTTIGQVIDIKICALFGGISASNGDNWFQGHMLNAYNAGINWAGSYGGNMYYRTPGSNYFSNDGWMSPYLFDVGGSIQLWVNGLDGNSGAIDGRTLYITVWYSPILDAVSAQPYYRQ